MPELETLRFHFHRLTFTFFKEQEGKQTNLVASKGLFAYLNQERMAGRGVVLDRNKGKKGSVRRELFAPFVYTDLKNQRVYGSIALLRAGRLPRLKPHETFTLIELSKSAGEIAEETHFFVDYSGDTSVICIEYNHNGPRISDLEFYIRTVANDRKIAKGCTVVTLMDVSLEQAVANLSNVLNFEFKVQPQKIKMLEPVVQNYFTSMTTFGEKVRPRFLRVEAMFQQQGKQIGPKQENVEANKMMKYFLNLLTTSPEQLDTFESFELKYEDKDGADYFLDLMKGKKEIVKENVDVNAMGMGSRAWYDLIKPDFDEYMNSL
jgi:hypothetical protein